MIELKDGIGDPSCRACSKVARHHYDGEFGTVCVLHNFGPSGHPDLETKWPPEPPTLATHASRLHEVDARPSFPEIYMRLAGLMAKRSTCVRLQVGCAIVSFDFRKVLAVGYNGNATGLPNKCDTEIPGRCGCLHAEENAVINCDAARGVKKIVFCTNLPCAMCAKRLINLGGVDVVHYAKDYRVRDSLEIFKLAGIPCEQLAIEV